VDRHAGRTTVNTEDVMLLARKSKGEGGLEEILKRKVEELRGRKVVGKSKSGKR